MVEMGRTQCGHEYGACTASRIGGRNRAVNLHLMRRLQSCQAIFLPISRVKQRNVCGCGLASLEMVLRYHGATDTQVIFLSDGRIRRQVECSKRGLSEGTLGTLALKRGFHVTVHDENQHLTKTFFRLGGKISHTRTSKCSIMECLRRGIPPIVLIPSVKEAYESEVEEIGHYVVVTGVNSRCSLQIADPQYTLHPKQEYWNRWSSSLIEITPRHREPDPFESSEATTFKNAPSNQDVANMRITLSSLGCAGPNQEKETGSRSMIRLAKPAQTNVRGFLH